MYFRRGFPRITADYRGNDACGRYVPEEGAGNDIVHIINTSAAGACKIPLRTIVLLLEFLFTLITLNIIAVRNS